METLLNWWNFAELKAFANRAATAACIFGAFWIASKLLHAFIKTFKSHVADTNDLFDLLGRVASVSLILFGFITALGTVGVDVSALVAGWDSPDLPSASRFATCCRTCSPVF